MAYRLIVLLLILLPAAASASDLASVIASVKQYPLSRLVQSGEEEEVKTHEVMLGSLEKSGGIVQPEASKYVTGRRAWSTWYIPNEQRTRVVSKFFKEQLETLGDLLFSCEGYGCGSSNYWANNVFDQEILYGPEEDQHYFIARVVRPDATYYVAVYVALRGTRKLYTHTDVIGAEHGGGQITGDTIVRALKSAGKYVIDDGDEDDLLPTVVDALREEPLLEVAIVRHVGKQRGETVDQAIARSQQAARAYAARLVSKGVDKARVPAYGVGPLSPSAGGASDRIELVLISSE